MPIPFAEVLDYLESHEWRLCRIHPPHRVFYQNGDLRSGLPILVAVEDRQVDKGHFEEIKRIVEEQQQQA